MSEGAGRPNVDLARALTEEAVRLLGDREWHPYASIQRALMARVPPGVAMRRVERRRTTEARRRNRESGLPYRVRSPEELIASGAKQIATDILENPRNYEIKPRYLKRGQPDERQIRMLQVPRRAEPIAADEADRIGTLTALRTALRQSEARSEHLADQVSSLRTYLIGLGHEKRANEIAPPEAGP